MSSSPPPPSPLRGSVWSQLAEAGDTPAPCILHTAENTWCVHCKRHNCPRTPLMCTLSGTRHCLPLQASPTTASATLRSSCGRRRLGNHSRADRQHCRHAHRHGTPPRGVHGPTDDRACSPATKGGTERRHPVGTRTCWRFGWLGWQRPSLLCCRRTVSSLTEARDFLAHLHRAHEHLTLPFVLALWDLPGLLRLSNRWVPLPCETLPKRNATRPGLAARLWGMPSKHRCHCASCSWLAQRCCCLARLWSRRRQARLATHTQHRQARHLPPLRMHLPPAPGVSPPSLHNMSHPQHQHSMQGAVHATWRAGQCWPSSHLPPR